MVELPRDTPPGQLLPVSQNLATLQNETIDLTIDSSPDQTPEPEPPRPRPRQTARMTTGGNAAHPHPRMSTGGIAPVRRMGRPPKPTTHMNSDRKRAYPHSDSSAEEDDEEFSCHQGARRRAQKAAQRRIGRRERRAGRHHLPHLLRRLCHGLFLQRFFFRDEFTSLNPLDVPVRHLSWRYIFRLTDFSTCVVFLLLCPCFVCQGLVVLSRGKG